MDIYLRALDISDSPLFYKWRMDPSITELLGGPSYFASLHKEQKWVEEKICSTADYLYLAICLRKSDAMIGYTSINNIDFRNKKAEWGGTIIGEKEYWGKGIAKAAAILMLRYVFDELGMHRCYGYCLQEHEVSNRLLLSLNFSQEGILRDNIFKNGAFHNTILYSILRCEYEDLIVKLH